MNHRKTHAYFENEKVGWTSVRVCLELSISSSSHSTHPTSFINATSCVTTITNVKSSVEAKQTNCINTQHTTYFSIACWWLIIAVAVVLFFNKDHASLRNKEIIYNWWFWLMQSYCSIWWFSIDNIERKQHDVNMS